MKIDGAIFDMDGTLVDSLIVWDFMWSEMGRMYLGDENFRPSREADKAVRTMILSDAMEYIHKLYSLGESGKELFNTANELIITFYKETVELKKGALELLEYLYKKGVKMCIASATATDLIEIALEHCKIRKYFSDILSCSEIGKGKDSPEIYLEALRCLDTPKESTWVFEDSFVALNTVSNIGLHTVGIYDKNNFDNDKSEMLADIYVSDGESLAKIIH
ncbi:MAG: HAD family phosphatase [Clostridia bacterium]|nr:HAD family phosphatase [Clostridia bacterium]